MASLPAATPFDMYSATALLDSFFLRVKNSLQEMLILLFNLKAKREAEVRKHANIDV